MIGFKGYPNLGPHMETCNMFPTVIQAFKKDKVSVFSFVGVTAATAGHHPAPDVKGHHLEMPTSITLSSRWIKLECQAKKNFYLRYQGKVSA